jgi:oligoribonuclease (3'-5' exoribonuclease)
MTGLNPQEHNLLEIGAIVEDTEKKLSLEECPKFHCLVWRDNYFGTPAALAMNAEVLKEIAEAERDENGQLVSPSGITVLREGEVAKYFKLFLKNNNIELPYTAAGKNFGGFDAQFLQKLPHFMEMCRFRHTILDPGPMFMNFKTDYAVPSTGECKARAKIYTPDYTHRAIDDAWDVILMLRTFY